MASDKHSFEIDFIFLIFFLALYLLPLILYEISFSRAYHRSSTQWWSRYKIYLPTNAEQSFIVSIFAFPQNCPCIGWCACESKMENGVELFPIFHRHNTPMNLCWKSLLEGYAQWKHFHINSDVVEHKYQGFEKVSIDKVFAT